MHLQWIVGLQDASAVVCEVAAEWHVIGALLLQVSGAPWQLPHQQCSLNAAD
jgi:hypothetical protein